MGFRFRKSFNIIKGVKANVSNSGVSFTIGGKGASINTGKNGTYVNLGIPGTGISYRKKLGTTTSTYKAVSSSQETQNAKAVQQYNEVYDQLLNIHKYTANVEPYESFAKHLTSLDNEGSANALNGLINGNQDFINIAIENRINDLKLPYDCNISYQLEDSIVYLDIDLPEIADMPSEYPTMLKNGSILTKKYTATTLKQNYAGAVLSLAIHIGANIFNISPYIQNVVISGYTQTRDKNGDLIDQYIYSFDFNRTIFEQTDLQSIVKPYEFILKFNNRINLSTSFSFKSITPFVPITIQGATEEKEEEVDNTETTVAALKTLGYKVNEINAILPELRAIPFTSDEDYLKQALSLIKAQKKL